MVVPVILCGGSGTRLWPLSRALYPKQFMDLGGNTLFGDTLTRACALSDAEPLVVCNEEQRFSAAAEAQRLGISVRILLEPEGRNTAPAVTLAALCATAGAEDPLLLVLPADHRIEPCNDFIAAVERASEPAGEGRLVCFGVVPERAETGFGYIRRGAPLVADRAGTAFEIACFVEKPSAQRAEELLAGGDCFWNSGIFLFRASRWLEELARFAPEIDAAARAAWGKRREDRDFLRPDDGAFRACPSDSVDYAVMEHAEKLAVTPLEAQWNDLGSWEAFYAVADKDVSGNALIGDVLAEDVRDSYLYAGHRLVAALGVEDLTVVECADAVLVAHRSRHQDVKKLLQILRDRGRPECDTHRRVYRPWGNYETLVSDEQGRFQVKRIEVRQGAALSLQYHHHRAEHWIVVSGTAKVTVGDETLLLCENQSTYISPGTPHRLENSGCMPLIMIEVQSGSYLGEDDIVRLEDVYGRLGPDF